MKSRKYFISRNLCGVFFRIQTSYGTNIQKQDLRDLHIDLTEDSDHRVRRPFALAGAPIPSFLYSTVGVGQGFELPSRSVWVAVYVRLSTGPQPPIYDLTGIYPICLYF
jgi:hypothetical protein